MNVLDVLKGIWEASGFAALTWKQAVMIGFSFLFIYLAIGKKFEPLLLLPIAFGMLLANLPDAGLMADPAGLMTELPEGVAAAHWYEDGVLRLIYAGVKSSIFPCLIFLCIGAMTDFGPLIANPKSFLLGAAAQNKAEWDEKALLRLERILKMDDCRAAAELSACANRAKTRLKKSAALLAMR